jgi:hypothetical protein
MRQINRLFPGAQVNARMTCTVGHQNKWSSCGNIGEKDSTAAVANIEISASILLSGLRHTRLQVRYTAHVNM